MFAYLLQRHQSECVCLMGLFFAQILATCAFSLSLLLLYLLLTKVIKTAHRRKLKMSNVLKTNKLLISTFEHNAYADLILWMKIV